MKIRSLVLAALLASTGLLPAREVPIPEGYVPPFFPEGKPLEGLTITIDAGHGGSAFSPGYSGSARGINSRVVEGDLNMVVTALLYHHLKDAGAKVHMTRRDDRKMVQGASGRSEELGARTAVADETRSHLFLSIHHNSSPRRTADGVMILIWPTDKAGNNQPLETAFADILREELQSRVHAKERFSHYVVDHPLSSGTDVPSAVVEYGFLSNPEFDAWVVQPTSPKVEAEATYHAVVRMWSENRAALEALNRSLFPDQESPTVTPTTDPVYTLGRPNASVWGASTPAATLADAQFVTRAYRNAIMTDRTSFFFSATPSLTADSWRIAVTTSLPQLGEGVRAELEKALAKPVALDLSPLPADKLGAEPFGVVQIPMALTWSEPREGAGVQTQLLLGEPLFLLDVNEDESYFLVQGIEGYVGWVRGDAVARLDRAAFTAHVNGPSARVTRDFLANDFRVPAGAFMPFSGDESTTITLRREAQGNAARGSREIAAAPATLRLPTDPAPGLAVAETALSLIYTPYVFGGRSSQGMDCSGLVSVAWASAGVQLPRDANQQIITGRLVGTSWYRDALVAGDVLFFADKTGRIIHTGISMGGDRFVHCSPPEVQINSFDPADALYSKTWAEAFVMARRPLD
jgi:N-acetylmuramoyl-L-alanine amidase/cell wall-associated NlpC family hydrolase